MEAEKKTTKKPASKKTPAKKTKVSKPVVEVKQKISKPVVEVKREKAPPVEAVAVRPDTGETEEAIAGMEEAFGRAAQAEEAGKPERYWEAVGRRKTAIARVRLYTRGDKTITVNQKPYGEYFFTKEQQRLAEDSLQKMKSVSRFRVSAIVTGGGLKAQAEAIRHGIARALMKFNPDFRKRLRRAGFLTRDPRMKERKKFGLKSARKRPQWAKR